MFDKKATNIAWCVVMCFRALDMNHNNVVCQYLQSEGEDTVILKATPLPLKTLTYLLNINSIAVVDVFYNLKRMTSM